MTTYLLQTQHFTAAIITAGEQIIQTPPILTNFCGRDWSELRSFAEQNRWTIVPVEPTSLSDWIDVGGESYEIRWTEGRKHVKRISLHEDGRITDLHFNQLPIALKLLL